MPLAGTINDGGYDSGQGEAERRKSSELGCRTRPLFLHACFFIHEQHPPALPDVNTAVSEFS